MKVVVLAKPVPNPAASPEYDDNHLLSRDSDLQEDEADLHSIVLASKLRNLVGSTEIVAISMSDRDAGRKAMAAIFARGADRGIVVSDPALRGSNTCVTAEVLKRVIDRESGVRAILAGLESADASTGILPARLASKLGWNAVTGVREILEIGETTALLKRATATATEIVMVYLPVVMSVAGGKDLPFPGFRDIQTGGKKNREAVEVLSVADLGLEEGEVGLIGSKLRVVDISRAAARGAGRVIMDNGEVGIEVVRVLEKARALS